MVYEGGLGRDEGTMWYLGSNPGGEKTVGHGVGVGLPAEGTVCLGQDRQRTVPGAKGPDPAWAVPAGKGLGISLMG